MYLFFHLISNNDLDLLLAWLSFQLFMCYIECDPYGFVWLDLLYRTIDTQHTRVSLQEIFSYFLFLLTYTFKGLLSSIYTLLKPCFFLAFPLKVLWYININKKINYIDLKHGLISKINYILFLIHCFGCLQCSNSMQFSPSFSSLGVRIYN